MQRKNTFTHLFMNAALGGHSGVDSEGVKAEEYVRARLISSNRSTLEGAATFVTVPVSSMRL